MESTFFNSIADIELGETHRRAELSSKAGSNNGRKPASLTTADTVLHFGSKMHKYKVGHRVYFCVIIY